MSFSHHERRREPRLTLRVRVTVEGLNARGELFRLDTQTYDVSPGGIGVELPETMKINDVVEVSSSRLSFIARAVVRNNRAAPDGSGFVTGLEFLDGKKLPVVDWHLDDGPHHADSH